MHVRLINSGFSENAMSDNVAIVNNVFRPDELWGFWFRHDWKVFPFIGDISHPPIYRALKCTFSNLSMPWVFAKFTDEILESWSMTLPETSDEFYDLAVTKSFFDEGCFLVTDASKKWGIISYNGDCFIVGGDAQHIVNFSQFLGGGDKLKAEFDMEMKKLAGCNFGEGAIIKMLPKLWKQ